MPKSYPSLKPKEVISCLEVLGFSLTKHKGDHAYYEKGHRLVQVDTGKSVKHGFGAPGMQIIISNSGYSREIFYRATRKTGVKIGALPLTGVELARLNP